MQKLKGSMVKQNSPKLNPETKEMIKRIKKKNPTWTKKGREGWFQSRKQRRIFKKRVFD